MFVMFCFVLLFYIINKYLSKIITLSILRGSLKLFCLFYPSLFETWATFYSVAVIQLMVMIVCLFVYIFINIYIFSDKNIYILFFSVKQTKTNKNKQTQPCNHG